ncbi:transposase [Nitrogeniibacter aestuarii]|uniref:transposase n=1 Tax=Nitrogeniibacter aestuarii TaxID=2815343 RepID=UPI001E5441B1|nr:transposase [Nitrogeniibacter aestuarii]
MAHFKTPDYGLKMIPVDFSQQVLPGSIEFALCHLVDHELDLSGLRSGYRNDAGGASAFDPAVLLKIVLLGYSRGLVSSRAIASACVSNVLFMAVSGDSCPHFTTIAAFVSGLGEEVGRCFTQVLLVCDRQGLIGRELFAIDGVKLPSNASKAKSGKRSDFEREAAKMEAAVRQMMASHAASDDDTNPHTEGEHARRTRERLTREAAQIRGWLERNPADRRGPRGAVRLSNRTDNESAKMATGKGVIQGYTGVATVDARAQIVLDAQAHGSGSEQELLIGAIDGVKAYRSAQTAICADAGYHSEANLKALSVRQVNAWICDNQYRSRDPRYAGQSAHKSKPDPLWDKSKRPKKPSCFGVSEFALAADASHCTCPAGKRLYSNGSDCTIGGHKAMKFSGAARDCEPCALRRQCLRKPDTTRVRQVAFFMGKRDGATSHTERMKQRVDSAQGKRMIAARFATVEPVFGNLRHNKRLTRFTLRGRTKVDGQWKLMCLMHNIEKLAHHGYAG